MGGNKHLNGGIRIHLENDNNDETGNKLYKKEDDSLKTKNYGKDIQEILNEHRKNGNQQEREKREQEKNEQQKLLDIIAKKEELFATGKYRVIMDGKKPVLTYKGLASDNKVVYLNDINISTFQPILFSGKKGASPQSNGEYWTDGKYVVFKNQSREIEGTCKEIGHGYLVNGKNLMYRGNLVGERYTKLGHNFSGYYNHNKLFNTANLKFLSETPSLQNISLAEYPEFSIFLTDEKFIIKGTEARETNPKDKLTFDGQHIKKGKVEILLPKKGVSHITKGKDSDPFFIPYFDPKRYR